MTQERKIHEWEYCWDTYEAERVRNSRPTELREFTSAVWGAVSYTDSEGGGLVQVPGFVCDVDTGYAIVAAMRDFLGGED